MCTTSLQKFLFRKTDHEEYSCLKLGDFCLKEKKTRFKKVESKLNRIPLVTP